MKTITIILILGLHALLVNPQKKLLRKAQIGQFMYSIYKEELYSHDDNWNAEYYTVYLSGRTQRLCSSYMLAKRNDSTFIKGNYKLYKDKIEFTQHYYYSKNRLSIDSIKITFCPNKYGKLILKGTKEFKNGKTMK